jgi:sugar lactone lactonase YvrE
VAFDACGNLYIADQNDSRIRRVDTNGIITTVAGNGGFGYNGDGEAATNASLNKPFSVAFDASGNLYIADEANSRIREVHFAGLPALTLPNVSVTNAGNYSDSSSPAPTAA